MRLKKSDLTGNEDKQMKNREMFEKGLRLGMPIGLGYFPVSFTFGFLTVAGGLPWWIGVFISLTNLTSAGQFAGLNLILAGAGYVEVAMTTFIINLRYMLMSLSLSQSIEPAVPVWQRLIFSFGITDETFVIASMEKKPVKAAFMFGLIILPIIGWNVGTLLGACISGALPQALQNAMGIAIYAMFIAIIIPPARESRRILTIIVIAVAVMCVLRYVPFLGFISSGFRVIIATVAAAGIGAFLYPKEDDEA